ncbi:hypothetical protein AV530_002852 [Patagioenas fasciata monilis]|uniref:Uncharacterized protein n=1 Tax=Patagioenas fasciata monilis TaxID=372326 RepID=A0A1V4K9N0_PATFA|nr:hypothetical protein AV530_002852 [Patagioenas fasciata monilis]
MTLCCRMVSWVTWNTTCHMDRCSIAQFQKDAHRHRNVSQIYFAPKELNCRAPIDFSERKKPPSRSWLRYWHKACLWLCDGTSSTGSDTGKAAVSPPCSLGKELLTDWNWFKERHYCWCMQQRAQLVKPASPLLASSVQDSADELHHAQKPQLFDRMTYPIATKRYPV